MESIKNWLNLNKQANVAEFMEFIYPKLHNLRPGQNDSIKKFVNDFINNNKNDPNINILIKYLNTFI